MSVSLTLMICHSDRCTVRRTIPATEIVPQRSEESLSGQGDPVSAVGVKVVYS
jgi:hypothetical protein